MLSNKTYDVLKWTAQLLLPALGTLYFALSLLWGFPYGNQIVGTITALDIFLGIAIGASTTPTPAPTGSPVPLTTNLVTNQTVRPLGFLISMSNSTYDTLVKVAQYILPGIGALVFAISAVWGWADGGLVVGTFAALDVFLGTILGVSTSQYKAQGNTAG
jgi:hypothetical protein